MTKTKYRKNPDADLIANVTYYTRFEIHVFFKTASPTKLRN